jgi:transposase
MEPQNKLLDFTGYKLFIGIDVHLNQWTVTIRLRDLELRTFSMDPSPQKLLEHVKKNYPHADYYSTYEAGFCGFWAHRELTQLGIKNIVVNPADVPTTHKEKTQKRDKRDSRKLARELADGSLDAIYIPTTQQESLRLLSRLIIQIAKRTKQLKCRIKQFLHTQGIMLPKRSEMSHWSGRFIHWLKSLEFEHDESRYYLDQLLISLEQARKQKTQHLKKIRTKIKGNQIIQYLRSVPGVGLITAFTFYTEIMDIFRFQKLDHLIAFIGLIPSVEASDKTEKIIGLTNRCNKYLRYLLIEAAWVAVRTDPALTLAFQNLLKTQSKQRAIIRMTKKLVNRMRHVWKNQREYVIAVIE